MEIDVRPYRPADRSAALDLAIRIWEPVFAGMRQSLPPFVYDSFYPDGWETRQRADIGALLDRADGRSWVAVEGAAVVGLVVAQAHPEDRMGEIVVIGVHPERQRRGTAAALTEVALDWMRDRGLAFAMAETGDDPGHAPAWASPAGRWCATSPSSDRGAAPGLAGQGSGRNPTKR